MAAINVLPLKLGKGGTRRLNKKLPTSGTPVNGAYAQGALSMATKPTADDTVTIGDKVYKFVASPSAAYDVAIGAAVANSQANLVAAINGDALTPAHPDVAAADFATNVMIVSARVSGTAGNSIATTETFTDGTDAWDAATMGTETAGVAESHTDAMAGDMFVDSSYLYICVTSGNPSTQTAAEFRRISLGSAY